MPESLPKPTNKVLPFARLSTLDQATDYALAGYHAAIGKAEANTGAIGRLWKDASDAYAASYGTILGLRALSPAEALKQASAALHNANHLSDLAATGAVS